MPRAALLTDSVAPVSLIFNLWRRTRRSLRLGEIRQPLAAERLTQLQEAARLDLGPCSGGIRPSSAGLPGHAQQTLNELLKAA
jgi:hypothetical protein